MRACVRVSVCVCVRLSLSLSMFLCVCVTLCVCVSVCALLFACARARAWFLCVCVHLGALVRLGVKNEPTMQSSQCYVAVWDLVLEHVCWRNSARCATGGQSSKRFWHLKQRAVAATRPCSR